MGFVDDMKATAKNIEGKAQETTGNITGNKTDQLAGKAKQAQASGELRWVPFTGQFWPLTSLTSGGRNRVHSHYRPHGEFCLQGSCVVLHGSISIGIGPG